MEQRRTIQWLYSLLGVPDASEDRHLDPMTIRWLIQQMGNERHLNQTLPSEHEDLSIAEILERNARLQ
jgi:hypothetical protein